MNMDLQELIEEDQVSGTRVYLQPGGAITYAWVNAFGHGSHYTTAEGAMEDGIDTFEAFADLNQLSQRETVLV